MPSETVTPSKGEAMMKMTLEEIRQDNYPNTKINPPIYGRCPHTGRLQLHYFDYDHEHLRCSQCGEDHTLVCIIPWLKEIY